MKGYTLYNNCVQIVNDNGSVATIYFSRDSGKVYFRYKVDSITAVKHPGIYLGYDMHGNRYFMHNHIINGRALIVTEQEFTKGHPIYIYNEYCSNSPMKVIEIGLAQVLNKETYKLFEYNCQTFTNTACHNQRKSEDGEKLTKGLIIGGLAMLLGVALFS